MLALLSYFPALVSKYKLFYIAVFLVCCWAWSLVSRKVLKTEGMRQDGRWLLIFFAYLTLTAAWAQYASLTLVSMAVNSIFLLVWALSYLLARNNSEARLADIFVAFPYVVAVVFAYMYMRFGAIRPYDTASMQSIGLTGNAAGLWLALALPFLLWTSRAGVKYRVALYLSVFLIAVSQSRAAYGIALFCFLVHGLLHARKVTQYVAGLVKTVVIVVPLLAIIYAIPATRTLVSEGFQRVLVNDESINTEADVGSADAVIDVERLWTFEQGWEGFTEHPLLGVGYNNITQMVDEAYGVPITSHNILLTLIAECGWPGLVIFAIMIWKFFEMALATRRTRSGPEKGFYTACLITMTALLIAAMVHPLLGLPLFYVILGLGCGAARAVTSVPRAEMEYSLAPLGRGSLRLSPAGNPSVGK